MYIYIYMYINIHKNHEYTDLDKIIGTPGIFVYSKTLALNFSLAKPNICRISFFMDCAIVSINIA